MIHDVVLNDKEPRVLSHANDKEPSAVCTHLMLHVHYACTHRVLHLPVFLHASYTTWTHLIDLFVILDAPVYSKGHACFYYWMHLTFLRFLDAPYVTSLIPLDVPSLTVLLLISGEI